MLNKKGISEEVVRQISKLKGESRWMLDIRLQAYKVFEQSKLPTQGVDLSELDFDDFYYYIPPTAPKAHRWDDVSADIKETCQKLEIPQVEQNVLSGVGIQFDSEVVYRQLQRELTAKGVIFTDMDSAVREHPEKVKRYFGKLIPTTENKLVALNTAVWSGGSFVYIPHGVHLEHPLQAYFRINTKSMGQFERTIIIAEEASQLKYYEGCTAPTHSENSLHIAVVEVFIKPKANIEYAAIQNWSRNIYNLITTRVLVGENARVHWTNANLGSKVTAAYPTCILEGDNSSGEILSLSQASEGQIQDTGAKVIHLGKNTKSLILAKSVSSNGGQANYRGLAKVEKGAKNAVTHVACDSLILDGESGANTYPAMEIYEDKVKATHEATTGKIEEAQLFYLQSRGIPRQKAKKMIVSGFVDPILKHLPTKHAAEMERLMEIC